MKLEDINRWMAKIRLSEEERKVKQPNWDTFLKYFRGLQWQQARNQNQDIITVNMVYSTLKVTLPSVYFQNPHLFMRAVKPSAVARAKIQETLLNQDMVIMDLKSELRRIITDVILLGTGISKTTYYIEYEETSNPQDKSTVLNLVETFRGTPNKVATENTVEVGKNGPSVIRVSPFNIATRVGIKDIRDPGFIAHKSLLYLEDVKNDDYYQNTSDLQATVVTSNEMRGRLSGYYTSYLDSDCGMVEAWEVWDMQTMTKFIIAEGHDKLIRQVEDIIYPYDHPFDILKFTEIPDEFWGMSEIEPWLDQLDELNKYRTRALIHTKRFNRKYLLKRGSLASEQDKSDLEAGEDGTIVEVNDPTTDVKALEDAGMSQDIWNMTGVVKDDIVEIGGITPYKRGLLRGAKTATEANIAETNSQTRDGDRVSLLGEFVLKVMHKVRLARKEFTPGEDLVQVTGDPGAKGLWEIWSKETFTEDVFMEVQYGSSMPINPQQRRQDALLLYQTLSANPTINPQTAAAKLLEAYDERDISSWFLPAEIIQQQMLIKAFGQQEEQKGLASQPGQDAGNETGDTPAETGGQPLKVAGVRNNPAQARGTNG